MRQVSKACSWLAAAALWLAPPALAGSTADLDGINGFRDVRFGDRVDRHPGMQLVENASEHMATPPARYYQRRADKLRVGTTPIARLRYLTWSGVIVGVEFTASKVRSGHEVRAALESRYGPPTRTVDRGSSTHWWWTGEVAMASIVENEYLDDSYVKIMNLQLQQKLQEAQLEVARKEEMRKRAVANPEEEL